jgi:hypothetical protein
MSFIIINNVLINPDLSVKYGGVMFNAGSNATSFIKSVSKKSNVFMYFL